VQEYNLYPSPPSLVGGKRTSGHYRQVFIGIAGIREWDAS